MRNFTSVSGERLALHVQPAAAPRCELVFLHGWGDHGARYAPLMTWLAARGVSCLAPDFAGHGASSGPRARVHDFDVLLRDLEHVVIEEATHTRRFLYGHSMGGALAAHFALQQPTLIAGVVFDCGALGINPSVPRWKRSVSRALGGVWPTLSVGTLKEARHMSASPEKQARYRADAQIWHGAIDAGTGRELLCANAWIERERHRFALPFLALQGMEDELVDVAGPRLLRDASGAPAQIIELPGVRHDLLLELGVEALGAHVESWLVEQCAEDARTELEV